MLTVDIDNLSYIYADGTAALTAVSLQINTGESVALVGANGAGKSTLLHHLNGLLTPTAGHIHICDQPLNSKTLARIRRHIGMVFQNPDDQLFMTNVIEDVCFGPLNLGLTPQQALKVAREALDQVGVLSLQDRTPCRLSDGEKRRVAIAGVLATSPEILVLDEPTSGLDPWARRQLIDLLKNITHTRLIATHDFDLVHALCERTIVLSEGKIVADGPTALILTDDFLNSSPTTASNDC
ncbi:MAG: cobalt ABC transporter ATP-binding protein [Desulfuromonadales bacterium C00003068]|jgi:cobalt/nickel transport system ATP-binding protein|nr:MAG: cobalt ABC transporter ATP-binding protein [Desulfuromonadales bacterium C00003068]